MKNYSQFVNEKKQDVYGIGKTKYSDTAEYISDLDTLEDIANSVAFEKWNVGAKASSEHKALVVAIDRLIDKVGRDES